MARKLRQVLKPTVDALDDRLLLSGPGTPAGFSPAQIGSAYNLTGMSFTAINNQTLPADGTGETIAIVSAFHNPNVLSDLKIFDSQYGLPDPIINQVTLGDKSSTNDGWASEVALDVEWAHAIAPGAKILLVEAASDSTDDLIAAIDVARNQPDVVVVSMSWGGSEFAEEAAYDTHFTTPKGHAGITFIAATGDTGPAFGAEWPAVSPNVIGVGGTTLSINSANGYLGESAWKSGGSGVSLYINQPAFQQGHQATGRRTVPDVAFLADPGTGVAVYATLPSSNVGNWQVLGGTSLGTPAWAGIVAIIDQGLAFNGKPSIDGPTQLLPALYALNSSDFHTVADAKYTVTAGLRAPATISTVGLGTPDGSKLITDILKPRITPPLTSGSGTTVGSTTTGSGTTVTNGNGQSWTVYTNGGFGSNPVNTPTKTPTPKPKPKPKKPKAPPRKKAAPKPKTPAAPTKTTTTKPKAAVVLANPIIHVETNAQAFTFLDDDTRNTLHDEALDLLF